MSVLEIAGIVVLVQVAEAILILALFHLLVVLNGADDEQAEGSS